MKLRFPLFAFLALVVMPALADDIYKWVDETGRTQLSDVVPEKYKKSATRIDGKRYELTAQQRAESDARSEKERAVAADAEKRRLSAQAAASAAVAAAASAAPRKPKAEPDAKTDCETLQRLYNESQECFAPYVTTSGAIKAEAFQRCTALPSPTTKCGAPKAY